MGFPQALSTGRQTQLRQLVQHSEQYLLLTPNTVVWQTQPLNNVDGAIPFASFLWSGTLQGDHADVRVGMTVLISTSSDYKATTKFRGRVRKTDDTGFFYINETSVNLETTDYVTVLADYDIHERLERRTPNGTRYIDWDKLFEKLPPLISGLQSVYVDTSGAATVTLSFAPTVSASEAGAAIASHLWDVDDGTITVGTTTSQNITVEFPGAATNEHRWVRYTATDDNGVAQYFVFEVFTIDPSAASSSVVKLDAGSVAINAARLEGFNATVNAWAGVDQVLDLTRCTIVSIDDYNGVVELPFTSGGTTAIAVGDTIEGATSGATAVVVAVDLDSGSWAGGDAAGTLWVNQQAGTFQSENLDVGASSDLATIAGDSAFIPVTQNVAFVGRLQLEDAATAGDETYGQTQDVALTVQGFSAQLALIIGPGAQLDTASNSAEWGEITTMTVGRALIYGLAEFTTFLNVCSLTLPADIHDYDWPSYALPPAPMIQWVNDLTDDINAYLIFSASGECVVQRHASYAGVSGLTTVATFEVDSSGDSDIQAFNLNLSYTPTITQALIGAATYNTSTGEAQVFKGRAPAQVYGPGWELAQLNQQIMKSDLSNADAATEAGNRIASHLAFVNPKARLSVTLPSGFYWIVPADHLLYAFNIAAADNLRGRTYTSSDKWVCVSVDYRYDVGVGGYEVNAVFEIVTTGANYGITVTEVVNVNELSPPDLPPIGAGLQPSDPLLNYPLPDLPPLPGEGSGFDQPNNPKNPPLGCDQFSVSMKYADTKLTHNVTQVGETYIVVVEGDAEISAGDDLTYDMTDISRINLLWGVYQAGQGNPAPSFGIDDLTPAQQSSWPWYGSGFAGWGVMLQIVFANAPIKVTNIAFDYYFTHGFPDQIAGFLINFYEGQIAERTTLLPSDVVSNAANGTWKTYSKAVNVENVYAIDFGFGRQSGSYPPPAATGYIDNVVVTFEASVRGDAFYYGYQGEDSGQLYASSDGFLINNVKPAAIPPFNSSHVYAFPATGTDAKFQLKYSAADYSQHENKALLVQVCGPGMALSEL